jgi:hypothetical protein
MPTASKAVARRTTDEQSTELSELWLDLARTGGQDAIETLRQFVETVEKALPLRGGGLAMQREIIDAGLKMAQAVLHAEYAAMRGLVRSAVLVNVNVNTKIDSDVSVDVPTNVDVASRKPTREPTT